MRTWTATITVSGETVDADLSDANLKADQLKSAVREAVAYLDEGGHAEVKIYKTTKTHGTVLDTSRTVTPLGGKVFVQ